MRLPSLTALRGPDAIALRQIFFALHQRLELLADADVDLSPIEADIAALESAVTALNSDVSTLQTDLAAVEDVNTTQDGLLDARLLDIQALDVRVAEIESFLFVVEDRLADLEAATQTTILFPTLGAAWTNFGGGYSTLRFIRVGDQITCRGVVSCPGGISVAADRVICTLPANFMPVSGLHSMFTGWAKPNGGASNVFRFDIDGPTGQVKFQEFGAAGGALQVWQYASLDGVAYTGQ